MIKIFENSSSNQYSIFPEIKTNHFNFLHSRSKFEIRNLKQFRNGK